MPAVGPQGSKGGLLAAVVVFTILFVTATIFAIYFGVDDSKKTDALQTQMDRTRLIYSNLDLQNPRYNAIQKMLQGAQGRGKTVLSIALSDSQSLAEVIGGKSPANATDPNAASQRAQGVLADAANRLPDLNLTPTMDLVSAIGKLTDYTDYLQHEATNLRAQQTQAAGDAANQIAQAQETATKAEQDATAANKAKDDAMDQVQKLETDYQSKVKDMQMAMDATQQKMNLQLQQEQQLAQTTETSLQTEKLTENRLIAKLDRRRVNPIDPLLRQPDGIISSVASDDVVYISLGAGDHIVPGMTFEVYSRRDGIPKQDDLMDEEDMPIGLASIEVEEVLQDASECRVIKTEIGQHISTGDLIANLVYDRNTKYNMVVYGNFDLSQSGRPNKADAERVKALISDWGGIVQSKINEDTDFVIMGKEPQVEEFTEDQLEDPLNKQTQDDEKAEYDAYEAVLNKATSLGIPVMNQNRFLYFCGYYDNAQR